MMFVSLLIAAALCVLAWVYVRWTRVRQYWAKRGVPHLPPHPVMGSLTFLQRQNPGRWMINTYQHFKTPYVGAWWFWRPTLIINSPEIARNVLVKDFANFRDRLLGSGSSDPIGHLNIFTVNEPLWSSIRRRLTSLFTACKLRALQNLLDTKANQLIERIKSTENKSAISLRILFTDYTSDVIGTAAFGVETKAIIGGDCPMRKVTKAFMTFDLYRGICWSSIFFFPELVNVFRFTFFPKWATDYFTKVFRVVSKQRKDEQNRIVEPKDLVDALIKLKQESDEKNEGLTEDIIVAQAAIFLLGGFETSGSALSFALYELAFKPEIQEKMYNELIQIKEQHENCSRLDISKLAEAPYVNSVIKEALRKYSPMGWLDRIAVNDYKIDDNLTIEAGTPIYVNAIGMQYDENYFPNPLDFDPERFMPENEKNIKPFTYLPFGEGPRNCIGKRFGQISVRNALSHVILNYKVAPVANQPKPNDIEFEKHGLFLVPGQDLFVDFIPRN